MNLKDRVAKAKEDRKGFQIPEGMYNTRFKGAKFTKTQTDARDMIVLDFKILSVKEGDFNHDEIMDKIKTNDKKIEMKCILDIDFQFNKVIEFVDACGGDLETIATDDPKWRDLMDMLEAIEEESPKVEIRVTKNKQNLKYNNYNIYECEKVLCSEAVEAPVAPKAPVVSSCPYTYDQLSKAGWTDKQIGDKYPELMEMPY